MKQKVCKKSDFVKLTFGVGWQIAVGLKNCEMGSVNFGIVKFVGVDVNDDKVDKVDRGNVEANEVSEDNEDGDVVLDEILNLSIADSFKYKATCLLIVELRGPRSCWTASLFIPTSAHFFNLQARHWFLWVLSTGHLFALEPLALHKYWRFLLIER